MNGRVLFLVGLILAALMVWAYGPTIIDLRRTWDREPDYSHGYLVIPVAVALLALRWKDRPARPSGPQWKGLTLIALSCAMKAAGAVFFLNSLDGWSLPVWILGCFWLFGGRAALWAAPAVGFLLFMVPLPYRGEQLLSLPLQRVATIWSSWLLQTLTVPAIAEGNTILLGDARLEVQQACNGLRTLIGIVAVAYVLSVALRRPWWKKAILAAATIPVAMSANTLRITATGLVMHWTDDAALRLAAHDWSGRLMIPVAACLFFLVVWYVDRLWIEVSSNSLIKIDPERMDTTLVGGRAPSRTPST